MNTLLTLLRVAFAAVLLGVGVTVLAQPEREYRLTIRNTNDGQNFSRSVVVAHRAGYRLFEPGAVASEALWRLAEEGDPDGFADLPARHADVERVHITPPAHRRRSPTVASTFSAADATHVSVAAMLTLTNDGFVAVRDVRLPNAVGEERTAALIAWDAGSEANTESCAHVPCEVHGRRMTEGAEGTVARHPGIRGDADVAARRGWRGDSLGTVTLVRIR